MGMRPGLLVAAIALGGCVRALYPQSSATDHGVDTDHATVDRCADRHLTDARPDRPGNADLRSDVGRDGPGSRDSVRDGPGPDQRLPDQRLPDQRLPDQRLPDQAKSPDLPPPCGTLVYVTATTHNGNFGGRVGVDQYCQTAKPAGLSCSAIHALVSVGLSDSIATMPTTFGYNAGLPLCWVHGATLAVTRFASNWTDLLDGSISVSRRDGTGSDTVVWTGSNNDGTLTNDVRFHCSGWTTASYGANWNFHWSYAGNVGSGAISMPDVTASWLYDKSTFAKKKLYGPSTCCYYNQFVCPCPCPTDDYVAEGDEIMCGGSARLMCACVP